jgi:hypothetical protein
VVAVGEFECRGGRIIAVSFGRVTARHVMPISDEFEKLSPDWRPTRSQRERVPHTGGLHRLEYRLHALDQ